MARVRPGWAWAARGVLSFSIAGPTGEGVTTPLTFCRQRRDQRRRRHAVRLRGAMNDATRAGDRHGDLDDQASDVRRGSGCWSSSSRRRPGGPDGEPILAFDRLGAGRGDLVLVTNDGRALQEILGPTTPGRWSVIGTSRRHGTEREAETMRIARSDRTSDAVAAAIPSSGAGGS